MKNFLWITPFITFIFAYYIVSNFHHAKTLKTPAIVGKTLANAFKTLSDHNLHPHLLAEKEEADLPDGTILSQNPVAGSIIKSHQAVYCVVSKKPAPIIAGILVNKDINLIKKTHAKKNIKIQTYYLENNKLENSCIAQFPEAKQAIKEQTMIAYASSGNNKSVICPRFIGKKLQEVTEFLDNYNITPEIIHNDNQSIALSDAHIVDQRPLPGSLIALEQKNNPAIQLKTQ